jgi:putative ABC transport system ATP-binding protein
LYKPVPPGLEGGYNASMSTQKLFTGIEEEDVRQKAAYLRLEHVCKVYQEGGQVRKVLSDVNLSYAQGEIIAILGKSGSGKSTLLNLISGIDRVDCGEIYLGDLCLTGMNDQARTLFRRKQIGFVFQFFNLIPTLTVWENLVLPLELNGSLDAFHTAQAVTLLEEVGLADRRKSFPDRLSGGEQQRLAIGRALVHDPSLLLADEPTGNLDEETGMHILELLERLTRKARKNMILVTHSPEAASIADRTFRMHEGRLEEVARS